MESVWVESTQTGPRSHSIHLLILRKGDGYLADHYQYSRGQIQRLANAITDLPVHQLDLKILGINQKWLDANAEQALRDFKKPLQKGKWAKRAENKLAFDDAYFLETFKKSQQSQRAIAKLLSGKAESLAHFIARRLFPVTTPGQVGAPVF